MSDARLREAERRWRESGAAEDEAAWLRERVRAGELGDDRLRLAAYVGHRPSVLALGAVPPAPAYVQAWVYGLERWGEEACLRAAIAAARRACACLRPGSSRRRDAGALIARAERQTLGHALGEAPELDPHVLDDDPPARERSAFLAVEALADGADEVLRRAPGANRALEASARAGGVVIRAVEALDDEAVVRAAIRDEVAPWALGEHDPLVAG